METYLLRFVNSENRISWLRLCTTDIECPWNAFCYNLGTCNGYTGNKTVKGSDRTAKGLHAVIDLPCVNLRQWGLFGVFCVLTAFVYCNWYWCCTLWVTAMLSDDRETCHDFNIRISLWWPSIHHTDTEKTANICTSNAARNSFTLDKTLSRW